MKPPETIARIDEIERRLAAIHQLCQGDMRGPLLAIPDHPDAPELQAERDALGQELRGFRDVLPKPRRERIGHARSGSEMGLYDMEPNI